MKLINQIKQKMNQSKGFSTVELIIVLLIISILIVIALPQILTSRRLIRFSSLQRQITVTLRDARQEAMSQRLPITVRYDDVNKRMITYGGKFGPVGTAANLIADFSGEGLIQGEIIYGKPAGASASALGDSSNIETLVGGKAEIMFQVDGAVVDAGNNPQNKALFFYDAKAPSGVAFAISVLGAGGRVKTWRYNPGTTNYVE